MTVLQLTEPAKAATIPATGDAAMTGGRRLRRGLLAGPIMLATGLGGCVTVKAPDKPIVIELNINIRQEVVYRLARDAEETINDNAGIF